MEQSTFLEKKKSKTSRENSNSRPFSRSGKVKLLAKSRTVDISRKVEKWNCRTAAPENDRSHMLFAIQQPTLPIARQLAIYILWFHIGLYIVVAPILILVNLVTLFVPPWYDAFFFTTRFFFFVRSNPERANSTRRSFITISCWAIVVFFHALVTLVIITIIKLSWWNE